MKKKRRKPAKVATVYVIEQKPDVYLGLGKGTLAEANVFHTRASANESKIRGERVIPCRLRVLTSKRRNAKRNG